MTEELGSLVYLTVLLMLVASSLLARRLPFAQTARMVVAWVWIFAAIFVIVAYRAEFKSIFDKVRGEFSSGMVVQNDGSLRVKKAADGHFWIDAQVNGKTVRFMVDSGATTTSMSLTAAQMAQVDIPTTGFPVIVSTANGLAEMRRARIGLLMMGPIERRDFPVLVSDTLDDTNLLGMNFLSSLQGWRIEGDELILNP